jgi:hypothetical protein
MVGLGAALTGQSSAERLARSSCSLSSRVVAGKLTALFWLKQFPRPHFEHDDEYLVAAPPRLRLCCESVPLHDFLSS